MLKRRALAWMTFWTVCLLCLVGRLMEIQLFETETFSKHNVNLLEESVKQRSQELIIDNGRGNFVDRQGKWLTQKKISVLVLFPFLKQMEWHSEKISEITGIPNQNLRDTVEHANKPFVYGGENTPFELTPSQINQINALKIPGVFAVHKNFERTEIPAEQLIGLVGENPQEVKKRYRDKKLAEQTLIGISGLEQSFDEFLLPEGKSKLIFHVDGSGGPLFGTNVRYIDPANPFFPVKIRTTIDKEIQQNAERLADSYKIKKGGLVLLNLKDNSILAMVSRPNIDKNNPYSGIGMANMMVKQQIIGSVFKTVVAAAAIDHNLDTNGRLFDCSHKINGSPDLEHPYGELNFADSFARSCNHTFGILAQDLQKMNPKTLEQYAEKLSLSGPAGWKGDVYHTRSFRQISDEEEGRVFLSDAERKDVNFAAMTGIGQHEVRATPLAVANMMATIANGGKKNMIRAVAKIEYKNGTTMMEFNEKSLPGETISPYTAMRLQKLLREVVINPNGTGRWFQNLPYEVAGKSGTAETGKYENGMQLHNKWFAGYFPYRNPKYALVTVNLDVPESAGGVNPLFADMVKLLYQKDQPNW